MVSSKTFEYRVTATVLSEQPAADGFGKYVQIKIMDVNPAEEYLRNKTVTAFVSPTIMGQVVIGNAYVGLMNLNGDTHCLVPGTDGSVFFSNHTSKALFLADPHLSLDNFCVEKAPKSGRLVFKGLSWQEFLGLKEIATKYDGTIRRDRRS